VTAQKHPAVNFDAVDWYVRRASSAYLPTEAILNAYPDTVHVNSPDGTDVLYFLERCPDAQRQVVTVRGTDNVRNALQDAEYLREKDRALGISVHRGFDEDAHAVYRDLQPHLVQGYETRLTGHSLGAAISTLLMMYLHQDGYKVSQSINFGQPKLTNLGGAKAYAELPLLRVVDANDVVPLLPAATVLDSIDGIYTHLGRELVLLDGPHYAYLDQREAMHQSRESFWHDLGHESIQAHHIGRYVERVADKLGGSIEVAFSAREQYISAEQPDR
jgi:hypothetical protein